MKKKGKCFLKSEARRRASRLHSELLLLLLLAKLHLQVLLLELVLLQQLLLS